MRKRHILKIMDRLNDIQCRLYWCNHVGSLKDLSESDREIFFQINIIYQKLRNQTKDMPDDPKINRIREFYDSFMGYPQTFSYNEFKGIVIVTPILILILLMLFL